MAVRLTIFQKGLLLVGAAALVQLALIALVGLMQARVAEANRWYAHTQEVMRHAETLLTRLAEVESASRGYVLTNHEVFLATFDRGRTEVPALLAALRAEVIDNPPQAAAVDALRVEAAAWLDWHGRTAALVREGNRDEAARRVSSLQGKTQLDGLRRNVAAFLAEEEQLDQQRMLQFETLQGRLRWLLLGSAGISLATFLALAVGLHRGISHRLAVVADNVAHLQAGDTLRPPLGGFDDITRMDAAVHALSSALDQSRRSLQEQTGLLQSILEQLGDGVVAADAAGNLIVFNPAAERILGVSRTNQGPERWADHYNVYLPDGNTPCATEDLPLVRSMRGEAFDAVELCVRVPLTPAPTWLSFSGRPLKEGGGVVVFHDITERKLNELQIRSLNTILEERVQQRTDALVHANRDLEHKNQDLEMFIYSVSHDLRSPLVNLQGFSKELETAARDVREILTRSGLPEAARERGMRLVDEDMRTSIRFIQTAVTRLGGIIDALLRLSRAGRVEYQRQRVDMNALATRVVDSLRSTAAERGAAVDVDNLPAVWGDSVALEQVFANLIGNALNYLDPSRPGHVEVGTESPGTEAFRTYFVRDNGVGIPEAHLPKLFKAFQRLQPAAAKGEGIGLVLVRRIVERHGGRIRVESRPGLGSTFYVTLPADPRPDSPAGQLQEETQHVG